MHTCLHLNSRLGALGTILFEMATQLVKTGRNF
jgi:hypothetical protein